MSAIDWSKVVTAESLAADTLRELKAAEQNWVLSQLDRADDKINAREDLGEDAATWRAYRVALRAYYKQDLWPAEPVRPSAPDA